MLAELTRLTWPTIVLGGEAKRREIANRQICHQLTTRMRHWQLHCPHLQAPPLKRGEGGGVAKKTVDVSTVHHDLLSSREKGWREGNRSRAPSKTTPSHDADVWGDPNRNL